MLSFLIKELLKLLTNNFTPCLLHVYNNMHYVNVKTVTVGTPAVPMWVGMGEGWELTTKKFIRFFF